MTFEANRGLDDARVTNSVAVANHEIGQRIERRSGGTHQLKILVILSVKLIRADFIDGDRPTSRARQPDGRRKRDRQCESRCCRNEPARAM